MIYCMLVYKLIVFRSMKLVMRELMMLFVVFKVDSCFMMSLVVLLCLVIFSRYGKMVFMVMVGRSRIEVVLMNIDVM